MVDIKKFTDINLYSLLDIEKSAVESDIRRAYRRKALACHPDKNPDNPKAAELFHQLSQALEILLDTSARAAYDRVINAKQAAELRTKQLDSKRQKLKTDLEERERASNTFLYKQSQKTAQEIFNEEVERLRKEGSRLLEEEQLLMQQQLEEERQKLFSWDSSQHRIKIKWNAKLDTSAVKYDETVLRKYLQKYGDISALAVSSKKQGSALVEFQTQEGAEMAVLYEKGNMSNPLTLEWVGRPPNSRMGTSSTISENDFESLVLRQMRQAEERKKLIQQMMEEDKADT